MIDIRHYRKKPVVVEAVEVDEETIIEVAAWARGYVLAPLRKDGGRVKFIRIPTLEGEMSAHLGDYVIKGIKGEFYPVRGDIFQQTYDLEEVA